MTSAWPRGLATNQAGAGRPPVSSSIRQVSSSIRRPQRGYKPMTPDGSDPGRAALPARQGVLVTGLPRSGTSWVGKMLEAGREVVYVNEPLNPQHPPGRSPGVLNAEVGYRFQYICADNDDAWVAAFTDMLKLRYRPVAELRRNHALYDVGRLGKYFTAFTVGRLRGRRALIDDPYAVLSSAWFAERLGCQVVACVRHPVSFVGSWQRLGWQVSL